MNEPLLYKLVRFPLTAVFRLIYRPDIIGKNNIPENGRVILAGNHVGFLDCFSVACGTKRCVHFLAKDELSKGVFKYLFKALGVISVNRRSGAKAALLIAEKHLESEKIIAVFPEGKINRNRQQPLQFKKGAVRISGAAKSPIVPFAICGQYRPFRKGLSIIFLPPLSPSRDLNSANEILTEKVSSAIKRDMA